MNSASRLVASSRPSIKPKMVGIWAERGNRKKEVSMLETILIILVVLWALGFFAFHVGGLIHVLIVIALLVLVIRLLRGRRVL